MSCLIALCLGTICGAVLVLAIGSGLVGLIWWIDERRSRRLARNVWRGRRGG